MSRLKNTKTNVKNKPKRENFWFTAAKWVTYIFLLLCVCIYPFIIEPGYGVTSFVKYNYLVSIAYGVRLGFVYIPGFVQIGAFLAAAGMVSELIKSKNENKRLADSIKLSPLDAAVGLYGAALVISSVISPYKDELIWGYPSWNMGLASQLLFVFIYFMVSRFFDREKLEPLLYLSLLSSAIVFAIGILQRFGLDVFDLYRGVKNQKGYLSTIGQTSWFSSYMIIFVILSVFIVWYCEKSTMIYKAGLAHLAVGSVVLVVQDTDSAFAGLFIAMSFFFVWSFDSAERMLSFLETALVILVSWRVTGAAQIIAGDRAEKLGRMSTYMSQGPLLWVLIGGLVLAYLLLRLRVRRRPEFDISRYRPAGRIYAVSVGAVIAALAIYILLNTQRLLPEALLSDNNYLLFDMRWGNNRGAILHDTILSFAAELREDPAKAFFGVGADQFYHVIESYVSDWTQEIHPNRILTNAHNEWLTAIVNFGLFGGLAYTGIFVCSIVRNTLHRREVPYVMAIAGCAAAYMAHNLFCYQQYVCTPYIFAAIGLGEALLRSSLRERC